MATWRWVCLLTALLQWLSSLASSHELRLKPIHIGLCVDDHSFRDALFLISSVIETTYSPRHLFFHIVAVGKDEITSHRLKSLVEEHVNSCFFTAKSSRIGSRNETGLESFFDLPGSAYATESDMVDYEVVAFHLPEESGFETQLMHFKRRVHHWNSATGADMVRFFLPSLFPSTDRILYLDNDIIVGCCLEEIYDTYLAPDKVIGIVLDDLQWAVITQFQRHYNASHPLVLRHMTRKSPLGSADSSNQVPKEHFMKLVPRYPNDGVILFHTAPYNAAGILQSMDEIAMTNGKGEYVVNMGTQQFTVLTMYDRWEELTPRGNLRHFPDMARGFLMWFYYNGFVHYAGQSKPRLLCSMNSFKENWLRVQSYTSWLNNHYLLARQCWVQHAETVKDMFYTHCIDHTRTDPSPGDQHSQPHPSASDVQERQRILNVNMHNHVVHPRSPADLYRAITQILRHMADMSNIYVLLSDSDALDGCSTCVWNQSIMTELLEGLNPSIRVDSSQKLMASDSPLKAQLTDVRRTVNSLLLFRSLWSWRVYLNSETAQAQDSTSGQLEVDRLRDESLSYHNHCQKSHCLESEDSIPTKKRKKETVELNPSKRQISLRRMTVCERDSDIYIPLPSSHPRTYIRNESDSQSQYVRFPCRGILQDIKSEDKKHWEVGAITVSQSSARRTLSALYSLDTVFMRPKLMLVHLVHRPNAPDLSLLDAVRAAMKHLRRIGFLSDYYVDETGENAYVWGVRANKLEFQ